MSGVFGIAAIASVLLPMLQSRSQYCEEARRTVRHRQTEADQRLRHHRETIALRESLFLTESDHSIAQDMQRYRVRLALSRRQSSRDASLQHFLMNQTVLMMVGLMLGCAFCLIGQGILPPAASGPSGGLLAVYSASCGVAIGALTLALWCTFKVQERMLYFDHSGGSVVAASGDPEPLVGEGTSAAAGRRYDCGRHHIAFREYFACHVERLRWWSLTLLHVGACAIMAAGWSFGALTLFHQDVVAKVILLVTMGAPLLAISLVHWWFPDSTIVGDQTGRTAGGRDDDDLRMERCLDQLMHNRPPPTQHPTTHAPV